MNFFNTNYQGPDENKHHKKDEHNDLVIALDKRNTVRAAALMVIVAIFIFIGGYFWGQRTAIDQLLNTVERDSFADQIYYSMCSLYDQKDDESNEPDAASGEEVEPVEQDEKTAVAPEVINIPTIATYAAEKPKAVFYAQLAGFGTEKPASQLMQRLKQKNIPVVVIKRQSRSTRGKMIPWYQVITGDYADKAELLKIIDAIKKYEKIHDINIIERLS